MTKNERIELRKLWEARVKEFLASGQTRAHWCANHQLKIHQLQYWIKKFRSTPCSTPSTSHANNWLSAEWKEENIAPSCAPLQLRYGQATLDIQPGFDPELLKKVVQVLVSL